MPIVISMFILCSPPPILVSRYHTSTSRPRRVEADQMRIVAEAIRHYQERTHALDALRWRD